jgi:xanthine dehydrogenase accessory factor
MYDVALTTTACLRAGTEVHLAWAVATDGFSSRDSQEALAITPGGGQVGKVLAGSANNQLVDAAKSVGSGRLVEVIVGEHEALAVGLSCGGSATCVVVPASVLPGELWELLLRPAPLCLVLTLEEKSVLSAEVFTEDTISEAGAEAAQLFRKGQSNVVITEKAVITVLHPVPHLVVIGSGLVADALVAIGQTLGWQVNVTDQARVGADLATTLSQLDKLVVTSHDLDISGQVLKAGLQSNVGYVGALGSRRTQAARADWLTRHGVTDLSRIHGPAGLDIGSRTPPEIAVSIVAEAIAVLAGRA